MNYISIIFVGDNIGGLDLWHAGGSSVLRNLFVGHFLFSALHL